MSITLERKNIRGKHLPICCIFSLLRFFFSFSLLGMFVCPYNVLMKMPFTTPFLTRNIFMNLDDRHTYVRTYLRSFLTNLSNRIWYAYRIAVLSTQNSYLFGGLKIFSSCFILNKIFDSLFASQFFLSFKKKLNLVMNGNNDDALMKTFRENRPLFRQRTSYF